MGIQSHMKIITSGAEHHFLTFLEKMKINPGGWIACTFPFSKHLNHEELMDKRAFIKGELKRLSDESQNFVDSFSQTVGALPNGHLYRFSDNDVIILCCPHNELEQKEVRDILEKLAAGFPKGFCDYGFLTKELYVYQKIADHKLLTMKKMDVYEALGNENAVESLPLRRKKREEPIVLVVEDDRFTASYISGFLKEFDLIVARNGEEAVMKYIEYAPDAVFLDIHLPGINGHQTLQAIKCADPDAFVVMLSVDTAKSSIISASEHGAVSYLKKPFSRERVLNTLRLSPFIRDSRGILPIQRA
jgi:two-component system chemotaxis response regulator CheY